MFLHQTMAIRNRGDDVLDLRTALQLPSELTYRRADSRNVQQAESQLKADVFEATLYCSGMAAAWAVLWHARPCRRILCRAGYHMSVLAFREYCDIVDGV